MLKSLSGLAAFSRRIDWRHFTPQDAVPDVRLGETRIRPFGVRDERRAVLWLLRDSRRSPSIPGPPVPVSLRGLRPGPYRVFLWDTATGQAGAEMCGAVKRGGALRVSVPFPGDELALAIVGD